MPQTGSNFRLRKANKESKAKQDLRDPKVFREKLDNKANPGSKAYQGNRERKVLPELMALMVALF